MNSYQTSLLNRINRLKDDITRFKNSVCAYEITDATRYPENFESLGVDMAMKAEAIACSTRNIVASFPVNNRNKILKLATNAQGIEISEITNGYEIIIPCLLPKRVNRNNSDFLLEPLSFALENFAKSNNIERIENALICYIYEYENDIPLRKIRDYDNLERKEILDILNTYFLIDDSGLFCELHYSTKIGNRTCTRIKVCKNIGQISYL